VLQPLPRINLKSSLLSSDWVLGSSFQRSRRLLLPAILSQKSAELSAETQILGRVKIHTLASVRA